MDIGQYISSGVIESYVLGMADEQESRQVEEYASLYPEVGKALDSYRQTLEKYAQFHKVDPPTDLKQKIWEAVQDQGSAISSPQIPAAETSTVIPMAGSDGPIRVSSTWSRWVAAAAIVLLLISASLNGVYLHRYKIMQEKYTGLAVARNDLVTQSTVYQTRISELEKAMQIIHGPSMKPVVMDGVKEHPGMMATVYWSSGSKAVFLAVNKLPQPPAGMQYQLWAIVDGKPVSAGLLDMEFADHSLQQMSDIGNPQAFAITLEKQGGSLAPTMTNMYVIGKI